eukprot:12537804-Alexandrium_andersonii.AAC.1
MGPAGGGVRWQRRPPPSAYRQAFAVARSGLPQQVDPARAGGLLGGPGERWPTRRGSAANRCKPLQAFAAR